ncbi:MAG: DUF1292 domain-containing protein [Clostridia bacterium]|nr:DUF1292 domain-containing protein [Clostridia bacterium]
MPEENEEDYIYTLVDEDGVEKDFMLIDSVEYEGNTYHAMVPLKEDGTEEGDEYVILKSILTDDGEELITIEDDEEFDRVADIFDDDLSEIDYDA